MQALFKTANILGLLLVIIFFTGCTQQKNILKQNEKSFLRNPVIAHRGAWKQTQVPQNSIASLQAAIDLKCAGTEFDVHLTADDVLVVNHDQAFYGLDIEKSSYKTLLNKKHPNGETIPTVADYLKVGLKQNHTKLIFELKVSEISKERTLKSAEIVAKMVKGLKKAHQIEFISFDYQALKKIKEIVPQAQVAYLSGDIPPATIKSDGLTGIDYSMGAYNKHKNWIAEAKELGVSVNVWTVNEEEDMLYFLKQGVDYITTDNPALLFSVLRK
ncbi:MAG TPA: glycerophosphodiester phosphodiesterase family protein [Pelobium sp.]